jgi:hypothetical protein
VRKPITAGERTAWLEDVHQPLMRDGYLTSIESIVTNIDLGELERLIGVGDVEAAYKALHIDNAAFRPYDITFTNAFEQSATFETMAMPSMEDAQGRKIIFRFDIRNIETERWLQEYLGGFITSITDEQRDVVKSHILKGYEDKLANKSIALGIAGRIDPTTRMRQGGVVGLSKPQEEYVTNARRELTSGSIDDMHSYLRRSLRDKRFDSVVTNSITQGKPLNAETADKLVKSYSNRLLRFRAGLIAQVESGVAINQGKISSYVQAIRNGAFRSEQVEKTWRSMRDQNVRFTHKSLDNQVVALYDKFKSPSGALLDYPRDPEAPADERVGCRCRMYIRVNGRVR